MDDLDQPMTSPSSPPAARREWLAVLARADTEELQAACTALAPPAHECVRPPEVGMLMLRGRIGGGGAPFNFGEATVTRCAVRLGDRLGLGYTLGRAPRKAELIAVFDALLQDAARAPRVLRQVVEPLAQRQRARRAAIRCAAAASKVDFFTLVRGEA
jgi:alpha-D-ribose 1-methylphosphonate 5-triphosphate synthase subunit PhnG